MLKHLLPSIVFALAYLSIGAYNYVPQPDVYGSVMESCGDRSLIPFRYQGQYEDMETGLHYNRFRYYSPEMGMYISSDPIGLAGNNPTLYGYVQDVNAWLDEFGLETVYLRDSEVYVGKAKIDAATRYRGTGINATDIFTGIPDSDTALGVEQIVYDRMKEHIQKGNLDKATNINNPVDTQRKYWRYEKGENWLKKQYGKKYKQIIDAKLEEHYGKSGKFRVKTKCKS